MYGINLKYKFPMLSAMIGSAAAAAICGSAGVMANGIGVGGYADGMTGAMMLIIGFYFAAPHMGQFVNSAMDRFSKTKTG